MSFQNYSFIKLSSRTEIKQFDCGDQDLNEFLHNDAFAYQKQALAVTYILEDQHHTIAFFSIFNDNLSIVEMKKESKNKTKDAIRLLLPWKKRYLDNLPAIKIGRLAVCLPFKKNGIGTIILDYIKGIAIEINQTSACKFLVVDAYAKSLGFYEKNGFDYLTIDDENEETRQMYFNLTPLINRLGAD
jgi:GNAT superfamily N-acetyltransferase